MTNTSDNQMTIKTEKDESFTDCLHSDDYRIQIINRFHWIYVRVEHYHMYTRSQFRHQQNVQMFPLGINVLENYPHASRAKHNLQPC